MKKMLMMCAVVMAAMGAWAEYTDDCITFSSAESFTLKTANTSKNWDGTLWTSTDKVNWTEWIGEEISAAKTSDTYNLYVRGNTDNTMITGNFDGYPSPYRWVLAGSDIACTGNIETLRGATGNSHSPTKMADYCYCEMFLGCTSLTSAPALPVTTLADRCYAFMFWGCTALEVNTTAPGKEWKIPVISTTASEWGDDMFTGTAGTLQGQPALNTTYYIKSDPEPGPTPPGPVPPEPEPGEGFEEAHTFNGLAYAGEVMCGIVQVTTGKRTAKDQVKVGGFVMLADGKKQTIKSVTEDIEGGKVYVETKAGKLGDVELEITDSGFMGSVGVMTVKSGDIGEDTGIISGTLKMSYFDAKTNKLKTRSIKLGGVASGGEAAGTLETKGEADKTFEAAIE